MLEKQNTNLVLRAYDSCLDDYVGMMSMDIRRRRIVGSGSVCM